MFSHFVTKQQNTCRNHDWWSLRHQSHITLTCAAVGPEPGHVTVIFSLQKSLELNSILDSEVVPIKFIFNKNYRVKIQLCY